MPVERRLEEEAFVAHIGARARVAILTLGLFAEKALLARHDERCSVVRTAAALATAEVTVLSCWPAKMRR